MTGRSTLNTKIGDTLALEPGRAWLATGPRGALVGLTAPCLGTVTQIDDDGFARLTTPHGEAVVELVDAPEEPDTINAIRASLANLRSSWRHRSAESIDRTLADIDDRLAGVDVPLSEYDAVVELFGPSGARTVIAAARKLDPSTEGP